MSAAATLLPYHAAYGRHTLHTRRRYGHIRVTMDCCRDTLPLPLLILRYDDAAAADNTYVTLRHTATVALFQERFFAIDYAVAAFATYAMLMLTLRRCHMPRHADAYC